jgi:hypothetical protein
MGRRSPGWRLRASRLQDGAGKKRSKGSWLCIQPKGRPLREAQRALRPIRNVEEIGSIRLTGLRRVERKRHRASR